MVTLTQLYMALTMVYDSITLFFFLDLVRRLIFEARRFGSRFCLSFQTMKTPTLVDHLGRARASSST
jgi:hypothetical protein